MKATSKPKTFNKNRNLDLLLETCTLISSAEMNSMVSKLKICLRSPLCFMPAKKILSFLCSFLTVFLICRVLFTCLVTKPTTTYNEEKELSTEDLPEIVVCANPGFKQAVVEKYGYNRGVEYYFGFIPRGKGYSGWNGGLGVEQNSSFEMLEESFTVDHHLIEKDKVKGVFLFSTYTKPRIPAVTLRTLVYPHGRCLSFSPAIDDKSTFPVRNLFYLKSNDTFLLSLNITTFKLFFMDKTNSIRVYPDDTEMIGDRVTVDLKSDASKFLTFKTRIFRSQNIEGDPRLKCVDYSKENTYYDCIQNEVKNFFNMTIGCLPPPLSQEPDIMCNQNFNAIPHISQHRRWCSF